MVALYARLYLALTSSELLGTTSPSEQTVVVSSSLFDYFYAFNWFRRNKLEHWLLTHKMEHDEYLALHSPAVEWLVKCAAPGPLRTASTRYWRTIKSIRTAPWC